MFSSDKNVETIGQLVEVLKHYIGLRSEYMKLDVAGQGGKTAHGNDHRIAAAGSPRLGSRYIFRLLPHSPWLIT